MKKVLLLCQIPHHDGMMQQLTLRLRNENLLADTLNTFTMKYVCKPMIGRPIKFNPFNVKLDKYTYFALEKITNKNRKIEKIAQDYDIIDAHFFNKQYDSILKKLYNKGKKIKITIWGSDFYRASTKRREKQREIYKIADKIQIATSKMKEDFVNYYNDFEDKIEVANFGINNLELINSLENKPIKNPWLNDAQKNKIVVTCGYNGSPFQQHLKIISALSRLKSNIKDKIFLVFPMTYGLEKRYLKEIDSQLSELKIPYKILTDYLYDEKNAHLRMFTDLTINIQKTDAFSGSLQEHLYCGNVLLVGDWLPYEILDKNEVFYLKTSEKNLTESIKDAINNINEYKEKASKNKQKIWEISSWDNAGKNIAKIYHKIEV